MTITANQIDGLGIAINEADLVDFAIDPAARVATVTLLVPTLAADDPAAHREVRLLLRNVGRLAASLRGGYWNDLSAPVLPLRLDELQATVRSFGGMPIYGWDFFDVHAAELARWGDRLSLDWRADSAARQHSLSLFQDPIDRHLDLCVWFDALEILDELGRRVAIDDFIDHGRSWWQAFRIGDRRTLGHGMAPLAPSTDE